MTFPENRLAGPGTPVPPSASPRHLAIVPDAEARSGDAPEATRKRYDEKRVPCKAGCGTQVRQSNSTGLCRPCWLKPENRGGNPRKTDPVEQAKAAARILAAFFRRFEREDAGLGLGPALQISEMADHAVDVLGTKLYDKYAAEPGDEGRPTPAARIAAELGWENRDKAWKRFGPDAAARSRIAAREARDV